MQRIIYLDAGHGHSKPPTDYGACNGNTREADIVLAIAKIANKYLTASGYKVIMSRETELSPSELGDRVYQANNAKADLFISIHCNASTSKSASGFEVFYTQGSTAAKKLASCINNEVLYLRGLKVEKYGDKWNFKDRGYSERSEPEKIAEDTEKKGITPGTFYVLTHTNMPSVLIETLFISNTKDLSLLTNSEYQQMMALGIKLAVDKYFGITSQVTPSKIDPKFKEIVTRHCAKHNLSTDFVHSLIQQESSYDPNAVSSSNAKGLMQLLPGTFADGCKALGLSVNSNIFDPEINIAIGCWYLAWIQKQLRYSKMEYWLVAKAYNEGINKLLSLDIHSLSSKYSDAILGRVNKTK